MDPQIDFELLKANPKRSVHLEARERSGRTEKRVVKRFHGPDLLDRFRDRRRARNEYELLGRCRALGLPVPRALDVRRRRGSWEVASEYLESARPLDEWLRDPGTLDDHRARGARELGRLVARLMDAGLDHGDLHPGNFLVQEAGAEPPCLWLIDLAKSRLRSRVSARMMLEDLVQLGAGVREFVSDATRRRFLVAFLKQLSEDLRRSLPARAELGRRLEDDARLFRRRDIARRTRRWLRESSSVEPYDDERGQGFVSRQVDAAFPTRVQQMRNDAQWAGTGRLDITGRVTWIVDGQAWPALRESWKRQVRLFTHSIPCLAPLCISRAPGPWIALELPGDLAPLDETALDPGNPALRQRAMRSFGALIGALHDRGIDAPELRIQDLWTDCEGELRLGRLPELRDRHLPAPDMSDSSSHRTSFEEWSGPWSEPDGRAYLTGYAGALRHSLAERARVLEGATP